MLCASTSEQNEKKKMKKGMRNVKTVKLKTKCEI